MQEDILFNCKNARDPKADPELLQKLAESEDSQVREAVASNPNTPIKTLLLLGAEFPSQLLANPIFTLLLLENPKLSIEIPIETLRSLVSHENIPISLLMDCAERSDRELLWQMTINPNLSEQIVHKLTQNRNPEIAEAASLHIANPDHINMDFEACIQRVIAPQVHSIGSDGLKEIMARTNTKFEAHTPPFTILCKTAAAMGLPSYYEKEIKNDQNTSTFPVPQTIDDFRLTNNHLESFFQSSWLLHRMIALIHEQTPMTILDKASQSLYWIERYFVAKHPNTPFHIRTRLQKDSNCIVREAAKSI